MNKINEILKERGNRYGKFKDFSEISQKLKDTIFLNLNLKIEPEYEEINNVILEGLEMICHKLARIANGDPYYDDSYKDIAGYASLVGSELEKFNTNPLLELEKNKQKNKKTKASYEPKNWKEKCITCKFCNHIVEQSEDIDIYVCGNENNIIINSEGLQEYQECEAIWFLCNKKESILK